jgi:hypothetical protein
MKNDGWANAWEDLGFYFLKLSRFNDAQTDR